MAPKYASGSEGLRPKLYGREKGSPAGESIPQADPLRSMPHQRPREPASSHAPYRRDRPYEVVAIMAGEASAGDEAGIVIAMLDRAQAIRFK